MLFLHCNKRGHVSLFSDSPTHANLPHPYAFPVCNKQQIKKNSCPLRCFKKNEAWGAWIPPFKDHFSALSTGMLKQCILIVCVKCISVFVTVPDVVLSNPKDLTDGRTVNMLVWAVTGAKQRPLSVRRPTGITALSVCSSRVKEQGP